MIAQHGCLELSLSSLASNVALFRARIGPAQICATVKANAYGHGVRAVASALRTLSVTWACVYNLQEALEVATLAPQMHVLVLAPLVLSGSAENAAIPQLPPNVRLSVNDLETARVLAAQQRRGEMPALKVHVQVDTGLTRSGAVPEEAHQILAELGDTCEGLFAHFSHGEQPGHAATATQLMRLRAVALPHKRRWPELLVHVQNSGGAWNVGDAGLDLVRVGIALYGLQPSTEEPIARLRPVARLTAPVLALHERGAGVGVGYGHTFITARPSRLAIVPVGYGDGYPRALSNRGVVQVGGGEAPVVGRVSMDQIVVDVTDLPGVKVGDQVVVISDDPARRNCIDSIATECGTIGYEIATGFGSRLERKLIG